VTGDRNKVAAIEHLLSQFGIKELVRTGDIALHRSSTTAEDIAHHGEVN